MLVVAQDPFSPVSNHDEFEQLALEKTSGDPRLLYQVARHRLNGIHCTRNQHEAVKELQLSAAENYAPAQVSLAQCYFNGTGTKKDHAQGLRTLKLATANTQMRYAPASYEYGLMIFNGKISGTKRQAAKRLREACDQGMPEAMFVLAQMYEQGNGVKQMHDEAMSLYQQAADLGLPEALERLARSYSPDDYQKNGLVIPASFMSASGLRSSKDVSKAQQLLDKLTKKSGSTSEMQPTQKRKGFWARLWERLCNWWNGLFGKKTVAAQPARSMSAPLTAGATKSVGIKTPHPFTRVRYVDKAGNALNFPVMPGMPLPETRPEFIPPVNTLPYTMQPDPEFIKALNERPLPASEEPAETPSEESAKKPDSPSDLTTDKTKAQPPKGTSVADELGTR